MSFGVLLSVFVLAPTSASAGGELFEVSYPQGEVSFTELAPGDTQVHHATVSNTSETDFEVLVTSDWAQTSTAEAGVRLTAEVCKEAWQGSSCPGESLDIALSDGASTSGTARRGEQWDVRFVASLPADAGNETQGVSSHFTIDFAVYHASDDDPSEVATDPSDTQSDQQTPEVEGSDEDQVVQGAQGSESVTPGAAGSITVTQSSSEDLTTTQDEGGSSLAITGANLWALIALSVALALAGLALIWWKRSGAQPAADSEGSV